MIKPNSWQEEAWEILLKKVWDKRPNNDNIAVYKKTDLDPILSKYQKSGQGEIRIFNSSSKSIEALKKRNLVKLPIDRGTWLITVSPPKINFIEPTEEEIFEPINKLTDGMIFGIRESRNLSANPGETTLLAIANYSGVIFDFYGLKTAGSMFTGGRQGAGTSIIIDNKKIDISKAQIEIDGGFEFGNTVIVTEVKSSFKQKDFDINQALLPMLKWKSLLENKIVYSLVVLAETNKLGIEYRLYDLVQDLSESSIGMKISRSKKYILNIK